MCLTEFNQEQHDQFTRTEAFEEGRQKGIVSGERLLGDLIQKLLLAGRTDDILKASTDEDARNKLYQEFGIKPCSE